MVYRTFSARFLIQRMSLFWAELAYTLRPRHYGGQPAQPIRIGCTNPSERPQEVTKKDAFLRWQASVSFGLPHLHWPISQKD